MDSKEIDVHDATVRREPQQGSVAHREGQTQEPDPDPVGDSKSSRGPQVSAESKSHQEKAIEEAKTVISASHGSSVPSQPSVGGSPAEVARVLLGHQLDHFFLENLIGGGGMGAVFRARDTRLDRTVAIKVIPRVGEDAELQRRFRNEAQSAARLDHPNIARVYDVGQHGGWHYIVFEFIDGINLRDLVHRDGVLNVDDAVYYTRQVAEALDHAYRRGVVHRDIKPSNVLITTTGQAKLVDMGLARAQQLEVSEDMTASGVTLGTFDYISPEQAKDPRDADVRSDIYSLGCTLYYSLTGRPPYPSGTVLQKLLSHGSSPPPDPRKSRKDLSNNLVSVLHKMLAKQPGDRYRRPLDLISDLYQLAELERLPRSLSAGSIAIAPTSRFSRAVEYHLPWVAALLLLFLSAGWMQILSSVSSDLDVTSLPSGPAPVGGNSGSNVRDVPSGLQPLEPRGGERADGGRELGEPIAETGRPEAGEGQLTELKSGLAPSEMEAASPVPPETSSMALDGTGGNGRVTPAGGVSGVEGPSQSTSVATPSPSTATISSESSNPSLADSGRQPSSRTLKIVRVMSDLEELESSSIPEDRLVVESLAEAMVVADRNRDLAIIEVHGILSITTPLKVPRRGLTIRGTTPESGLDFGVWSPSGPNDQWLVDLGNYNLELENLDLNWQIPTMSMSTGSIFRMTGGNTVRLTNCTITIDDPDGNGSANAFVYAPESDTSSSEAATFSPAIVPGVPGGTVGLSRLVAIQLKNCVVRGGMTLLRMKRAGLLEMRWDNGLLCIDGCMIRTNGTASSDEFSSARARIIMDDVTAVLGKSLVSVELTGAYSQPFSIDREANRSVFSWGRDAPLVEVRGLASELAEDRLLTFRGGDNHYDVSGELDKLLLELHSEGNFGGKQVAVSEMLGMSPPRWIIEQSPQGAVNWTSEIPLPGSFHRSVPENFIQEGVVLPGFRISELPQL